MLQIIIVKIYLAKYFYFNEASRQMPIIPFLNKKTRHAYRIWYQLSNQHNSKKASS